MKKMNPEDSTRAETLKLEDHAFGRLTGHALCAQHSCTQDNQVTSGGCQLAASNCNGTQGGAGQGRLNKI